MKFKVGDIVVPKGIVCWLTMGREYEVLAIEANSRGQLLYLSDDDGDYMSFEERFIKLSQVTIQPSGRRN